MSNYKQGTFSIKARWPLHVRTKSHAWESWSGKLVDDVDIVETYEQLISRGADERYDFALFYHPTIAEMQSSTDKIRMVRFMNRVERTTS
jgi:hypothetical protein